MNERIARLMDRWMKGKMQYHLFNTFLWSADYVLWRKK